MIYNRNKIKDTNTRLKYWTKTSKINRSFPNLQALITCKYKIRLQVTLPLNIEITMEPAGSIEGNHLKVPQIILQCAYVFLL